jgi:methionyl-tRNA synthetase
MKPTITYDEFAKIEFVVGRVIAAQAPEWSRKLLEFTVDFGSELGQKTILSGVSAWYQPENFVNNNYLFVVNLAERKMGEGVSQGMMLMADTTDQPTLIPVPAEVIPGTIVR